jgi:hypothetical protein
VLQHRLEAAGRVTRRFPEFRRQRTSGDDRADAGKDDGHGSGDAAGELSKTSRDAGIFQLRAWRRVHAIRKSASLLVVARHDGQCVLADAQAVNGAGRLASGGCSRKESKYYVMCHASYLTRSRAWSSQGPDRVG